MRSTLSVLALGLLALAPLSTASAQSPALSPIPDLTVNANETRTIDIVATDLMGREISLTPSVPQFVTMDTPRVGMGEVVTTLTVAPTSRDLGNFLVAVTATADGSADFEFFDIRVNAEGSPAAPLVSAPVLLDGSFDSQVLFAVEAVDPDGGGITALEASMLPSGADFVANSMSSAGTFSWTPASTDAGEYDVLFTATSANGLSASVVTHLRVGESADDETETEPCLITGALEFCEGRSTELCGPEGAAGYTWAGPEGFAADTRCVEVGVAGTYELTVTDADEVETHCAATVTVTPCEVFNCPRGPGFWKAQCAQRGNGSTKFDRDAMDRIASHIDDSSDYFDWVDDFDGLRSAIDPPRPMDPRKQARRMYAVLLANVGAGELDLVGRDGNAVTLDPNTVLDCGHVEGVGTLAELIEEAELRLAELDGMALTPELRGSYESLKECMDAINDGIGLGPVCEDEAEDAFAAGRGDAGLSASVHPNPLNPRTEVSFSLTRAGRVRVSVYDVQGRLVKVLLDEALGTGDHRTLWDGSDQRGQAASSGVYLIRLQTPQGETTRRATLIK